MTEYANVIEAAAIAERNLRRAEADERDAKSRLAAAETKLREELSVGRLHPCRAKIIGGNKVAIHVFEPDDSKPNKGELFIIDLE